MCPGQSCVLVGIMMMVIVYSPLCGHVEKVNLTHMK